jgi:hypothetical protein
MIAAAIGFAICLFSVNAMAAAVFETLFPTNPGYIGEPAILLLNGTLLIGLGYFLRNRANS